MKRELLIGSLIGLFLVILTTQAQALTFDGTDAVGTNGLLFNGTSSANPSLADLEALLAFGPLFELYKDEISGEEKAFADSYNTSYARSDDYSTFDITYVNPEPYITGQSYLLVKDGTAPFWYFYDLTLLEWDGMAILSGNNFWGGELTDQSGAISHVSIYGTTAPVPEPATMLLFGTGLIGLAGLRARKRNQ